MRHLLALFLLLLALPASAHAQSKPSGGYTEPTKTPPPGGPEDPAAPPPQAPSEPAAAPAAPQLEPAEADSAAPAAAAPAGSRRYRRVRVLSVVDGDTLVVRLRGGTRRTVQLIGIEAPARGECGARAATAQMKRLLPRRRKRRLVTLTTDPAQADSAARGRLLAYVDGQRRDYGQRMVLAGRARVVDDGAEPRRAAALRRAEARAVAAERGIWRSCRLAGEDTRTLNP